MGLVEFVRDGGVSIVGPAFPDSPAHPCMRTFVSPGANLYTLVDPRLLELDEATRRALHRAHLELVEATIGRWFRWLTGVIGCGRVGGFAGFAYALGFEFEASLRTFTISMLAFGFTLLLDAIVRRALARVVRWLIDRAI